MKITTRCQERAELAGAWSAIISAPMFFSYSSYLQAWGWAPSRNGSTLLSSFVLAAVAIRTSVCALGAPKTTPGPSTVRMVQQWIPMSGGVRPSATLYMPEGKPDEKFPALLEYLPYRKDDST